MANKLTVRIDTVTTNNPNDPNEMKTVSKFVVERNDQVTFDNDGGADALVTFIDPDGMPAAQTPLCIGSNPSGNPIPVVKDTDKKLKVCVDSGQFEFKATVGGTLPEDPILIVERALTEPAPEKNPIIFPEGAVILLVVAVVAAAVGYLVGKRRVARKI